MGHAEDQEHLQCASSRPAPNPTGAGEGAGSRQSDLHGERPRTLRPEGRLEPRRLTSRSPKASTTWETVTIGILQPRFLPTILVFQLSSSCLLYTEFVRRHIQQVGVTRVAHSALYLPHTLAAKPAGPQG